MDDIERTQVKEAQIVRESRFDLPNKTNRSPMVVSMIGKLFAVVGGKVSCDLKAINSFNRLANCNVKKVTISRDQNRRLARRAARIRQAGLNK